MKNTKKAVLYRMVMDKHTCPYGIKSKYLLQKKGFDVEDNHLTSREKTDAFKKKYEAATTPQAFIEGKRIGGYDDLVKHFNPNTKEKDTSYTPIIAIFSATFLMSLATEWLVYGHIMTWHVLGLFISISMCFLGVQKLQNLENFTTMFINYDVLAKRKVAYAYFYPFAETFAGICMLAGVLSWFVAPLALFISTIGAYSVFKAVYIDKRELKCACVGSDSKVPLGFISLTENLMMMGMAIWMISKLFGS